MTGKLITSSLFVLLSLVEFAAAAGKIAFKQAQSYPVGTNPVWVVTGDFNNDGQRDLAVINEGDASVGNPGGVSILLGNGDGTFQPAKNIAIGKNCTGAVAGDFDGDGNDDLALVRPGDASVGDDGDVTIFLGNGNGTFRPGQVLALGTNPSASNRSIVAADLKGDQRLDLVVASQSSFSVFLGDGNGTFQSAIVYSGTSAISPVTLLAVDLAGNGEKDLAVFGPLSVDLWLNNGDGTFRQGPHFGNSGPVTAGDFNKDKKDDLVVTSISVTCVYKCPPGGGAKMSDYLLLGNGDGTFQPRIDVGGVSGAGDFDGDGKLDLVSRGKNLISVAPGNGDGTFQSPVAFAINSTGTSAQVLDVNGDTAPDVIIIGNSSISLLVNAGTDFSISASALDSGTLSAGQSVTSSIELKLLSNFDNPVSLTCEVQPAQPGAPTCSLSSSSVTFDTNGEAGATLTINASSSAASLTSLQPFNERSLLWLPVVGFALLGTGLVSTSSRRRFLMLPIGAVLSLGIIMQTACGGGGTSGGPKSTPYTVTVTAESGATQHSTSVTLTVQ